MISQREAIADFIKQTRPQFNQVLFERDEDAIIDELLKVVRACERENDYFTIKLESYRVVDNYDEINEILFNYYENLTKNKTKAKKRDNQYAYINLNDSCIRLLILTYFIKDRNEQQYLDVIIAIPRIVDKFYFKINGIMRSTLLQIVDGSTYNNGTSNAKLPSITLKITFMATRVTRRYEYIDDVDGNQVKLTLYSASMFNKYTSALKYIFAKFGYYGALNFLGISNCLFFTRIKPDTEKYYVFEVDEGIYLSSPRFLLDGNQLLQSALMTVKNSIVPGIDFENYFTIDFWRRSLGSEFSGGIDKLTDFYIKGDETSDTIEKGNSVLNSFETILDDSTRQSIRLPMSEKETTYHVMRWIVREFNNLRLKDNLSLSYKRIRFAEYIASLYAMKIARGIYRVSDMNKKATIMSIRKAIRTDPMALIQAITKSKMVSYRNMVSDMDAMQGLKFTYKGVSGLGEGSNKSIPEIYRSIHPSHIGKVDLDASSDGNPGITGTLCPYASIYDGGFFEDYTEPNVWQDEFMKLVDEYNNANNIKTVLEFENQQNSTNCTEALEVANEAIACMKSVMRPYVYADRGDIVTFNYEVNYFYNEELGIWQQSISSIPQNNLI